MENVLENKTNMVITRQLQSVIIRFFLPDFKNRIAQYNFGPVIDPTEGNQSIIIFWSVKSLKFTFSNLFSSKLESFQW